ncbi:MAG: serine/threonine protein kinase, partial [Gammaproteobacteria bacterium]|nr:serine/threonine protein kinase [Gammaproteobacteria bacterium]
AALKNGVDLYIEESRHANIRESIPQWYWRISSAGSFILLPMSVGRRGIGLIYADHPRARGMTLSVKQLNLMKALRNQILLAVRSRG